LVIFPSGSVFAMTRCIPLKPATTGVELRAVLEELGLLFHSSMVHSPSRSAESVGRSDLVAEQDAAYQASLEADRRKADEQREAEAAAARRAAAAAAAEAQAAREAAARSEQMATLVRPEPPEGDQDCYRVRFQLPDGAAVLRRFPADATVAEVVAFVASSLKLDPAIHSLVDPVARVALDQFDGARTLLDCGMPRRTKIHVQHKM
jgi:hypothetical protein